LFTENAYANQFAQVAILTTNSHDFSRIDPLMVADFFDCLDIDEVVFRLIRRWSQMFADFSMLISETQARAAPFPSPHRGRGD